MPGAGARPSRDLARGTRVSCGKTTSPRRRRAPSLLRFDRAFGDDAAPWA